jgi:predicted nuclease with RNAse H fold
MPLFYIGIDIQIRRNCCYAVIDDAGTLVDSGWLSGAETGAVELIKKWSASGRVYAGIDAPRMPLVTKRRWYWDKSRRRWSKRGSQKGYGRHCEIVISAHRIANPQWTPLRTEAPEWMNLGFRLYAVLGGLAIVYEVFPSASYALLAGNTDVRLVTDFSACKPGPKDMLDAWVAAATVREFVEGRGAEVGGKDGLGTIVLPRPLPEPVIDEVLQWPE